jgi:hypothetical protein
MKKQNKTCVVCDLLKNDSVFKKHINTRLHLNTPLKEVVAEFSIKKEMQTPSVYYLEQHKANCLKSFKPAIEDIEAIKFIQTLKNQESELSIDMDSFRKATLIEKDAIYQNFIHEIFYKKLVILSQDKKVSKDEINSLKSLYDLININNVDVSDIDLMSVKNKGDVERITLGLINKIMSRGMISTNNIISIIGSLFKADYEEHLNNSTSIRETRESLMEKIEKIQKVIDYANSQKQLNDNVLDTNL